MFDDRYDPEPTTTDERDLAKAVTAEVLESLALVAFENYTYGTGKKITWQEFGMWLLKMKRTVEGLD